MKTNFNYLHGVAVIGKSVRSSLPIYLMDRTTDSQKLIAHHTSHTNDNGHVIEGIWFERIFLSHARACKFADNIKYPISAVVSAVVPAVHSAVVPRDAVDMHRKRRQHHDKP